MVYCSWITPELLTPSPAAIVYHGEPASKTMKEGEVAEFASLYNI